MVNPKNTIKAYMGYTGLGLKATAKLLVEKLAIAGWPAGRDAEKWLIGKAMARGATRNRAVGKVLG
ncbi:MAG: hypothetical protein E6R03_00815 [Hyphomicrobiaceae bacterium]|nr:MAG: hypothetical protein E6R03_00815 [Hyphomicrobiaceae bacterium]